MALLGKYLLPEWKLDISVYMNVVESILYYCLGMEAQWEKGYPEAVGVYCEMVHFLQLFRIHKAVPQITRYFAILKILTIFDVFS